MRVVCANGIAVNTDLDVREGPVDLGVLYTTGWMLRCGAKHFELTEGLSAQASAALALSRYQGMVFRALGEACAMGVN